MERGGVSNFNIEVNMVTSCIVATNIAFCNLYFFLTKIPWVYIRSAQ